MATLSPFARDAYEIHSPRLIIRTAVGTDAEGIRDFITNRDNNPHTPTESDVTPESMRNRIEKWQELTSNGIQIITLPSTGELIGYGGYNYFDVIEELVENTAPRYLTDIGVMIAKSHWRKGYGLKTFYTFTEYAFITLDIMRVRIETDLANEPWRRLMHAVGLTEFEEQKRVTYGEKSMGYSWLVDAATWQVIREDMQKRGKWPL